jgi:predicted dehydrogenase
MGDDDTGGQKLRVAVVGLGIGELHLSGWKAVRDRAEIVAVCDLDAARAEASAGRLRGVRAETSLDEVLAADDIDVVDLCTPPALHVVQVEAALAAGKHAICEKPIAASLEEVDRLIHAEEASSHTVMPIFQYRYGNGVQKARALVRAGVAGAGRSATVEVHWRRRAEYYDVEWRGRWETELGGVLLAHAIHALDMLTYVAGPVRAVQARTATLVNPIEVEDTAAAVLELADGTLATVSATLGSANELSRHRFCFEHLSAESNTEAYLNPFDPWTFHADSPEAQADIDRVLDAFEPRPEHFAGQFSAYLDALAAGDPPPVTLVDARAALELITALYVSARERCEVELPIPHDHPAYRGWAP